MMEDDLDNSIEKARMLLQMKRTSEAIGELEKVLAQNPDSYMGLLLACAAYYEQQNKTRIKETANKFVATYPADDVAHYYMALASSLNKEAKAAEIHVRQAIAINPHDADYFGFLAALYIDKSDWTAGLMYANQGLEIEPENVLCLNHRTYCLTKLDRKEEILTAVQETLSVSPDSWYSHSNVGWSKLETGDYKEAKYHFAEALCLNPNAEQARAGMRETLKANNFLYKWYLKYQFWLGKFNNQMQWVVIIGFVIGRRVVFTLAASFPPLYILAFAMIFFVYSSWIIRPLGDFILMLDRFGRALLKDDEKKAGIAVGTGFLLGLMLCTIGYFADLMPLIVSGLVVATVIIPIGKYYHEDPETRSTFIKVFTLGITMVAVAVIVSQFIGDPEIVTMAYIIGIAAYTWIFNIRQSAA
jgi:tetratricopeptide (TPR) repeat protein